MRSVPVFAVQRAVLHGFGDVFGGDFFCAGEVGDRARDLQNARIGAVRQLHPVAGQQKQRAGFVRHDAGAGERSRVQLRVAADFAPVALVAFALNLPRGRNARANGRGGLGLGRVRELLGRNGFDLDMHVDSVQQRPRDAAQIPPDLRGRAAALLRAAAEIAARLCCAY